MYYCKTRYYVPAWCRWLNGDSIEYLKADNVNGMNLFSYCKNNPIMYVDQNGNMPTWAKWLVGGLVLAGVVAAAVLTGGGFNCCWCSHRIRSRCNFRCCEWHNTG